MSKLYHSDDIFEMIDNKLNRKAKEIVSDISLDGEELLNAVRAYRALKTSLYSLADDLKEADEEYEAEMAAWRAKQEAEKNGNS